MDVLLKDNESLSRALSTVTREKAELCKALSRLERTHRAPRTLQEGCTRKVRSRGPGGLGSPARWLCAQTVMCEHPRDPPQEMASGTCSWKEILTKN